MTLVATLTVAHHRPALADEDPDFAPVPSRSIGGGFQIHTTRIGGRGESGVGPVLELALGRGRWQYLVEGSVATAAMDDWSMPDSVPVARINGRVARGGFGMRWIARQFSPSSNGGVELYLSSMLGVQRFYFDDGGGRLTRPEIAFGFGLQGRIYKRPHFAFRLDTRVVFTPNDRESSLVACHGPTGCMGEAGSSTGFMTGLGIAW